MKSLFLFLLGALLCGCSTLSQHEQAKVQTTEEIEAGYLISLRQFTQKKEDYTGLYNTFSYTATLLTTKIHYQQLDLETSIFQWDNGVKEQKRQEIAGKIGGKTYVFLSFFTPETKHTKLDTSKSIWKIYLDSNGQRYEGVHEKDTRLLAELQRLYPYHNRFCSPYLISFNVPTQVLEQQPSRFTITGPLGIKEIEFPSLEQATQGELFSE